MSNSNHDAIVLREVTRHFRGPGVLTTALKGVSLQVGAGEFLAILGASGSGKTTLLNVLGLIDEIDEGERIVFGTSVGKGGESVVSRLRSRYFGYVFQSFHLVDTLSVEKNVELALRFQGLPAVERGRRVAEVLERLEIAHRAKHYPSQLSGGQQQRVAIARAVASEPEVILADEPTGNLDPDTAAEVMQILGDLNKAGKSVVVVTHSLDVAACATRQVRMDQGQLQAA